MDYSDLSREELIVAIDPKGAHLLQLEAGRKLLSIRDEKGHQRLLVRFLTEGTWSVETMKQTSRIGYSVWRMANMGQIRCSHYKTLSQAVKGTLELK